MDEELIVQVLDAIAVAAAEGGELSMESLQGIECCHVSHDCKRSLLHDAKEGAGVGRSAARSKST